MVERSQYTNRLINEKSPYLLQHAHNPVDWYPWGEEAFQAAIENDKPIFLSIGYSTCHWCHTMEHESFENLEVAELLNECFINIKVDREELPEVDSLYMEFAQSMMAGAAGWPLNVILTPQLCPFFAATYLPPYSFEGMMGMVDLIKRIKEVWEGQERERIMAQAEKIVEVFQESIHVKGNHAPGQEVVERTINLLYKMSDPLYGGMKGAPKFPIAYQVNLLLAYSKLHHDSRALFIAERTLDMMQRGGIYDHLGGGFSRYSTDEMWHVPHFEKMLYDNALLAGAYVEAWKLTKRNFYREVCEEIIEYILRDMKHPEGGFFSAEDADSEGVEGLFYTWTKEEMVKVLEDLESESLCQFFSVTENGNFEGRNILFTPKRLEEFCVDQGIDHKEFEKRLVEGKKRLWQVREKRIHPLKDDKILASWNGLMIHTLAEAGAAFRSSSLIDAALQAAQFIRKRMWREGTLYRRWREGEAHFSAGLEEYASLIRGVITLFEAEGDPEWLRWAIEMTALLKGRFKEKGGAFYQTDGTDRHLILRRCQYADGAEPSGNAIHCENLLRLYQLTYDPDYRLQAEEILKAADQFIQTYPPGYCYHMINLMRLYHQKAPTIIVSLNERHDFKLELRHQLFGSFIPHRIAIWRTPQNQDTLFESIPFVKGHVPMNGKTTVYICHDRICERPLTDIREIEQAIEKL